MATMTAEVKDELSRLQVHHARLRSAEVSALLRFGGGLQISAGQVIVSVELDAASTARRLRADIYDLFSLNTTMHTVAADGESRNRVTYIVRAAAGESLARRSGLLDRRGRPVRGLPAHIVGGSISDIEAAWRGAFLARGTLAEPGRANALDIACPSTEASLALVSGARRMGIPAKARDVRGVTRVAIREESVAEMLARMGARDSLQTWAERHARQQARVAVTRLASFDDANLRRSTRAAVATAARVERALEILGPDAPESLVAAGQLRVQHRQASLEELARLAEPPMSKDAMAGRIRRLLDHADREARQRGIPGTEAVLAGLANPTKEPTPSVRRIN